MRLLIVLSFCVALAHFSQARSLGQVPTRGIRSADTTTDTTSVTPSPASEAPKVDEVVSSQAPVEVSSVVPVTEQRVELVSSTVPSPTAEVTAASTLKETVSEPTLRVDKGVRSVEVSAPINAPAPAPAPASAPETLPEANSMKAAMESVPEVKEVLAPVLEVMKVVDEMLPPHPAPAPVPVVAPAVAPVPVVAPAVAPVPAVTPAVAPVVNDIIQNDSAMAREAAAIIAEVMVSMPKVVLVTHTKEESAPAASAEAKSALEPPVEASMPEPVVVPVEAQSAPVSDAKPIIQTVVLTPPADAEPPVEASMPEPVVVPVGAQLAIVSDAKPVTQMVMLTPQVDAEPPVEASMPEAVIAPVGSSAPVAMIAEFKEQQASSPAPAPVSPAVSEVPIQAARNDMIPAQEIHIDGTTAAPATLVESKAAPTEETKPENQVDNAPAAVEPKTESVPEMSTFTASPSSEIAVASTSAASPSSTETSVSTENAAPSTSEASAPLSTANAVTASSTEGIGSSTTSEPAKTTGASGSA